MTAPRERLSEKLSEIRSYVEAATAGPWRWGKDGEEWEREENHLRNPTAKLVESTVIGASGMHTEGYIYLEDADAEFIARARTDLPLLLDVADAIVEYERLTLADERLAADEAWKRMRAALAALSEQA